MGKTREHRPAARLSLEPVELPTPPRVLCSAEPSGHIRVPRAPGSHVASSYRCSPLERLLAATQWLQCQQIPIWETQELAMRRRNTVRPSPVWGVRRSCAMSHDGSSRRPMRLPMSSKRSWAQCAPAVLVSECLSDGHKSRRNRSRCPTCPVAPAEVTCILSNASLLGIGKVGVAWRRRGVVVAGVHVLVLVAESAICRRLWSPTTQPCHCRSLLVALCCLGLLPLSRQHLQAEACETPRGLTWSWTGQHVRSPSTCRVERAAWFICGQPSCAWQNPVFARGRTRGALLNPS